MQGSIKKRVGKRGVTWSAVVDLGRDPVTGNRKQKRLSARTRKDVEELLTKTLHEMRTGVYLEPSDEPLGSYLSRWLTSLVARPSTYTKYESAIRVRIVPSLGHVPLGQLTELHVQAHVTRTLGKVSAETAKQDFRLLSQALEQAVAWRLLLRNPCKGVKAPRSARQPIVVWSKDQARAFLLASDGQPFAALWRMALGTAMRRGELLALRWSDVDLEKRTVRVTRNWSLGPDGWSIGDVKTRSSRRQITLPASCVQALRALHVGVRADEEDDVLIWQIDPWQAVYRFAMVQRGASVPRLTFHGLRHTSATLMLLNGEHPKIVSERLGHSSVAITIDRYSHVLEGMQEAAADRLDALLGSFGDQDVTTEEADEERMA
jgi:integrase